MGAAVMLFLNLPSSTPTPYVYRRLINIIRRIRVLERQGLLRRETHSLAGLSDVCFISISIPGEDCKFEQIHH